MVENPNCGKESGERGRKKSSENKFFKDFFKIKAKTLDFFKKIQ